MPARTASEEGGGLRVAVLADSDTRWKWGALTARRIAPGSTLDAYLLRGRATPTPRQLDEVGVRPDTMREVTVARFLAGVDRDACDVLVLAVVGGTCQAVLHGLARAWRGHARRPVVVTGYVGVVYEKMVDGLLLRGGADVVLANSAHDAERFRAAYAGAGADPLAVVETALPFLDAAGGGTSPDADAGVAPHGPAGSRPFTVTFAAQPSVPESRADRSYLLRRLVRHAVRHPGREVLLKLRSRPGEHTTHVEEHPYQHLAARLGTGRPANLHLVHGNMGEVLDRTDLCVTVSSTAALESMHRGVPTAVLTDFGIREALGNHHFLGSGCLASWDELDDGRLPTAEPRWLARHGVAVADPHRAARERVAELAAAPSLPPLTPYYSVSTAGGYLPGVLARHGLGADGGPLPGAAAPGGGNVLRRAVRRVARDTARTAYRQGVQRVAPVIRRWGQL